MYASHKLGSHTNIIGCTCSRKQAGHLDGQRQWMNAHNSWCNDLFTWNYIFFNMDHCFGSAFFFCWSWLSKNLSADPYRIQIIEKCWRSFRNIDSKQPELHPVPPVPHIFSKLCHILLSMYILVMICFKKSLRWIQEANLLRIHAGLNHWTWHRSKKYEECSRTQSSS
jgi:hypothetical protein